MWRVLLTVAAVGVTCPSVAVEGVGAAAVAVFADGVAFGLA